MTPYHSYLYEKVVDFLECSDFFLKKTEYFFDEQSITKNYRNNLFSFPKLKAELKLKKITSKNIVLFTVDHWGDDEEFFITNGQRKKTRLAILQEILFENPDKNFVLFYTARNIEQSFNEYIQIVKNLLNIFS